MKRCTHCGRVLPEGEFYRKGGRLASWCKECSREQNRKIYDERMKDPEYVERERERQRDKWHRLYAGKKSDVMLQKQRLYPSLRSGRRATKSALPAGVELHHWNYNLPKSLIVLPLGIHHRLHAIIKLNLQEGIYYYDGRPLDTIEKHMAVVKSVCERRGVDFTKCYAI